MLFVLDLLGAFVFALSGAFRVVLTGVSGGVIRNV